MHGFGCFVIAFNDPDPLELNYCPKITRNGQFRSERKTQVRSLKSVTQGRIPTAAFQIDVESLLLQPPSGFWSLEWVAGDPVQRFECSKQSKSVQKIIVNFRMLQKIRMLLPRFLTFFRIRDQ